MAKPRQLVPIARVGAAPFGYRCDRCGRVFPVSSGQLPEEEKIKTVRADFEAHLQRGR